MKLGRQHNYHKGRAVIRHYANLRMDIFQALIQTLHSPTFSKLPPGYKFFTELYSVCDPVTEIPTES